MIVKHTNDGRAFQTKLKLAKRHFTISHKSHQTTLLHIYDTETIFKQITRQVFIFTKSNKAKRHLHRNIFRNSHLRQTYVAISLVKLSQHDGKVVRCFFFCCFSRVKIYFQVDLLVKMLVWIEEISTYWLSFVWKLLLKELI